MKIFKIIFLIYCLTITAAYAQFSYNGNMEHLDYTGLPSKWFTPDSREYILQTDSLEKMQGKYALSIKSKDSTTTTPSMILFQTVNLPQGNNYSQISVTYHVRFISGDTTNFIHFIAPQICDKSKKYSSTLKWITDTNHTGWNRLNVQVNMVDSTCRQAFIGFVLSGKVNMLIDSIAVYLDSTLLEDKPLPPLVYYDDRLIPYINNNSTVIESSDNYTDLQDLSFIRTIVGKSTVIGLGESTHGTKEFFTLRNRLILYLIDSLGFDIVAFENNYTVSRDFNTLLTQQQYTPKNIVDSLFGRIHQTEEMVELFDQIRKRNEGKKKSLIEGFDNQDYYYAMKKLKEVFKNQDPQLYSTIMDIEKYNWVTMYSSGKYDTLCSMTKAFNKSLNKRNTPIRKRNSNRNFKILLQYAVALQNAYAYKHIEASAYERKDLSGKASDYRDSLMAENIFWIQKFYPKKKIILIAHNGHIGKEYNGQSKAARSMGAFLHQKLGTHYKSIGFFTAEGKATGYGQYGKPYVYDLQKPHGGTYEYYLAKNTNPLYYLNLNPSIKIENLGTKLKSRSIGFSYTGLDQFHPVNLSDTYNGLIFIKTTNNTSSMYFDR